MLQPQSPRRFSLIALPVLFVALLSCGRLEAQPGSARDSARAPLQLELRNEQIVRSSGPIPLEMDLIWDGQTLLKGSLSIVLRDETAVFSRAWTTPLALNTGRTRVSLLLPSVEGHGVLPTIELVAGFLPEKGDRIDLGTRPLRVPTHADRVFRLLICEPAGTFSGNSAMVRTMSLERFWTPHPTLGRNADRPQGLVTYSSSVTPDALPADPAWLCSYNVLLLRASGLTRLPERHVETLLKWVRAGGSLLVETADSLDAHQVELINQLSGASDPPLYSSNLQGKLEKPAGLSLSRRCGLGRAVVLHQPLTDEASLPPDWNQVVAFLWNFRSDQIPAITGTGRFRWLPAEELALEQTVSEGYPSNAHVIRDQGQQQNELNDLLMVRDIRSGQGLLTRLMPDDVQVMPLEYIVGILFLYVLTIGPVDWFVLGAFKLRRLTWLTFPAATVGFTLFTVWLSHEYLDSSTERTAVTIVDLDERGEPVRSNRLELLFTMSTHEVTTPVKSGLFTPLDHSRFGSALQDNYGRRVSGGGAVSEPVFSGRPPISSEVRQTVPQWTPHINRLFQIAPDQETLADSARRFDWQKARDLSSDTERAALQQEIAAAFGSSQLTAVLYNGRKVTTLIGDTGQLFQSSAVWSSEVVVPGGATRNGYLRINFLNDICALQQGGGLFGIVKSIAPHGGDNFEDLTLLDPSDPDEWLLVIGVSDPENTQVYRRLYRRPGAASGL